MSAAKKPSPVALKRQVEALEVSYSLAKDALREAKKALKHREEQLAFMTKAAQGNAEQAEALKEVLVTMCRTVLRVRDCMPLGLVDDTGWPELVAIAEEWNP